MKVASKLTPLQERILKVLGQAVAGWRLVGGAALVGFYLGHRTTRDLGLFWSQRTELGDLPARVTGSLGREGLQVASVQTEPAFHRLRVTDGTEVTVVDLVAEPAAAASPPMNFLLGEVSLAVEPFHDIFVSKLCALLGRTEVRDVIDVRALLAAGGDLRLAVADAPAKDGGFSALTLAWLLRGLDVPKLARAATLEDNDAAALAAFVADLIQRLLGLGKPE
jgi:hypothetical protein